MPQLRKCAVIERCPVHCVSRGAAGKIVVDKAACTNCGKCIAACPLHSFSEKERLRRGDRRHLGARPSGSARTSAGSTQRTRS